MKAPCKECGEREIGCHGKCELYRRYKLRRNAESAYAYRIKKREEAANDALFESCQRMKRRSRKR